MSSIFATCSQKVPTKAGIGGGGGSSTTGAQIPDLLDVVDERWPYLVPTCSTPLLFGISWSLIVRAELVIYLRGRSCRSETPVLLLMLPFNYHVVLQTSDRLPSRGMYHTAAAAAAEAVNYRQKKEFHSPRIRSVFLLGRKEAIGLLPYSTLHLPIPESHTNWIAFKHW